jgi:hypothetical protein
LDVQLRGFPFKVVPAGRVALIGGFIGNLQCGQRPQVAGCEA